MKRVTGIGGIFFKAKDAPALQAWYKRHLGIDVQPWGGTAFSWTDAAGKPAGGTTIWSIGSADGDHFAPTKASFMINYRVEDLHEVVRLLKEEGCNVLDKIDESEYGKFAWVIDPVETKSSCGNHPPVNEVRVCAARSKLQSAICSTTGRSTIRAGASRFVANVGLQVRRPKRK